MSRRGNEPWFNWLQDQPIDTWIPMSTIPDEYFDQMWKQFEKRKAGYWFDEEDKHFMIVGKHLINYESSNNNSSGRV